jgi:glycerol uptake facilitator protein
MSPFIGELVGTALLIILGDGVVANVVLNKTKGNNSGWIVITLGWAMAVFVGVFTAVSLGGKAHLNPAVTIAFAAIGKIEWSLVATLIVAQMLGAMLGALIVWLAYRQHFDETNDAALQLAVFCNAPAIRSTLNNVLTEIIGTFVLIFAALNMASPANNMGALNALPVALIVLAIGLSLGGPTGYAINPARDLGPRIMHFILPIKGKGNSDWNYSWIPVVGPIIGGVIAALLFQAIA